MGATSGTPNGGGASVGERDARHGDGVRRGRDDAVQGVKLRAMRTRHLLAGLVAAVALLSSAACSLGSDANTTTGVDWTTVKFDSSLHVSLDSMTRTQNDDWYRDITVGTGTSIAPGMTVSVRYTGWLTNGTMFDSNADTTASPQPFQFPLGAGVVIPGWDDGLIGMKVGGVRQLVIPPYMAYGAYGSSDGRIPPNAVLVFQVKLVSTP